MLQYYKAQDILQRHLVCINKAADPSCQNLITHMSLCYDGALNPFAYPFKPLIDSTDNSLSFKGFGVQQIVRKSFQVNFGRYKMIPGAAASFGFMFD